MMNAVQFAMGVSLLALWACVVYLSYTVTRLQNIIRRQDEEQTDLFTKGAQLRYDLGKLRDRVARLEWNTPAMRLHLHGTAPLGHRQFTHKEDSDDVA